MTPYLSFWAKRRIPRLLGMGSFGLRPQDDKKESWHGILHFVQDDKRMVLGFWVVALSFDFWVLSFSLSFWASAKNPSISWHEILHFVQDDKKEGWHKILHYVQDDKRIVLRFWVVALSFELWVLSFSLSFWAKRRIPRLLGMGSFGLRPQDDKKGVILSASEESLGYLARDPSLRSGWQKGELAWDPSDFVLRMTKRGSFWAPAKNPSASWHGILHFVQDDRINGFAF